MSGAPSANAVRVALVAVLVLLAGCGVLGGGGGSSTPTANGTAGAPDGPGDSTPTRAPATTASAGTATATPPSTPVDSPTPSPTATPTPTPSGYETITTENESYGISLTLTGNQSEIGDLEFGDVTGSGVTRGAVLECARASEFIGVTTNGTVADATVSMSYDPAQLPENASESDLAVFAYNDTVQFYLGMVSTVDAANDTVTATRVNTSVNSFTRANGTETLRPTVDGTRLNNVFVVMHWPTFWEGYRTQEIPSQCETDQDS